MRLHPFLLVGLTVWAAPPPSLLGEGAYRTQVLKAFAAQRLRAGARQEALFGVFRQPLSTREREALQFLIAGMPLSDLGEARGEELLAAVRATHAALDRVPWGSRLPEDILRHYVLPLRVNNEPVDGFRVALHRELLNRVRGLDMARAVLEVNHWCHERVTYQSTDGRTSAPLATLKTTFGRCGEESTFTVAALRAVGIPARQVYTPRWAHSDDNHAWVEAWVDGTWRFLGACEPEPALDRGWFAEPARRAILVHTRAYGPYGGPEPVIRTTGGSTELNLTARYAPVKEVPLRVLDSAGRPVAGATVDYRLYNYGEFYPLASRTTDAEGRTSLATGRGTVLLWARQGQAFGHHILPGEATAPVTLTLDRRPLDLHIDQVPPPEPPARPDPLPAEVREAHAKRIQAGDRHRAERVAAFLPEAEVRTRAQALGLEVERTWKVLQKGAGNRGELLAFLEQASDRSWALSLLETVADKDLRDTPASVLLDHLTGALATSREVSTRDPERFRSAVLNPRVALELLTPWRRELPIRLPAGLRTAPALAAWMGRAIVLDPEANHARVPMSPRAVLDLRRADPVSRDIAFVAVCRSLGIPARLEPTLRIPQAWDAKVGDWVDAAFATRPPAATARVPLQASGDPRYALDFTLAHLQGGGLQTLQLPHGAPLSQLGSPLALPPGEAVLTTGHRLPGGTVLARLQSFSLQPGLNPVRALEVRQPKATAAVLGTVDPTLRLGERTIQDWAGAHGLLLIWAGPGQEPTRHVLNELRSRPAPPDATVAVVLPQGASLDPVLERLPTGAVLTSDPDGVLRSTLARALQRDLGSILPVVVALWADGRIAFISEGYRIGAPAAALQALTNSR